ncbi:MAG: tyrosine-type recombinase/integrase [Propionibacteriales bacterium]|nr:tyrosine-type recombinase/integrase [Propionibacteriales bacterium]
MSFVKKRGKSWRARYRGPDGRERSKSFGKKIEAERWLARQETLMASGDWTDPALGRVPFGSYAQDWLNGRSDLKPKTRFQYQYMLDRYVVPTWGNVQLAKITFEGVSRWVTQLVESGTGPSAVRQSVFVLSAALDHAVRARRIRANPARGIGLPKAPRRDYVILSHGQVRQLAAEADGLRTEETKGQSRDGLVITFLAYTGLRWGEMIALRARDIDLNRRRVDVRRAFSDVGGRLDLGMPKSSRSLRTVPLPAFLAAALREHLEGKDATALVFTTPSGTPLRQANWRRTVFVPACERAKVPEGFRMHDLRHTAASLMIQAGYPPKGIQEILGHASITTTLDLYGHLFPGDLDRWVDQLDAAAEQSRTQSRAAKLRPVDDEDPGDGSAGVSETGS